jgi:hypothetical protein
MSLTSSDDDTRIDGAAAVSVVLSSGLGGVRGINLAATSYKDKLNTIELYGPKAFHFAYISYCSTQT